MLPWASPAKGIIRVQRHTLPFRWDQVGQVETKSMTGEENFPGSVTVKDFFTNIVSYRPGPRRPRFLGLAVNSFDPLAKGLTP
jgi:hypothetical protein